MKDDAERIDEQIDEFDEPIDFRSFVMKSGINCLKFFLFIILVFCLQLNVHGQYFLSDANFSAVVGSGARALGMGGAFIAIADDPTAASWNPGGLGQLEQPGLAFVLRHQNYSASFPGYIYMGGFNGPENRNATSNGIDFFSFTYPIRIGDFKIVPQVSYQRSISYKLDATMNNVPFTERIPIEDFASPLVYEGTYTETDKFTGGLDTYSFSLGSQLFGRVNIGFSANFWTNGFKGKETMTLFGSYHLPDFPDAFYETKSLYTDEISVDISGFTFNVGILVELFENFKLGAVYKSGTSADIDYKAYARREIFIDDPDFQILEFTDSADTSLKWPETWGAGISYRPIDALTLSLDFTTTRWSRSYFSSLSLGEGDQGPKYYPSFYAVDNEEGITQLDTQQFRFGLEYIFIGKKMLLPLRFGFFTDSQYFSDSSGRRVTFMGITGGIGVKKGPLSFDAAFLYEWGSYLRDNYDYSISHQRDLRIYTSVMFSF